MGLIIDDLTLEPVKGQLEKGVVEAELRVQDERDMSWKYVKAQVSKSPFEGAEKAKISSRFGISREEVYLKVLEEVAK